ncbi:YbfB/YjiJ family MFS transporter [Marinobacterium weihaiense]|uniref:MFS transporter n=1 Tax=Marinobacterium weihaiense TaxID=2851016 RepID=A0ABS6M648_9GAMM|nr:YbfB/YjiJ family MFS transporter [Marinobacterium weihaiense]MBV0931747.1 MFS transporter [Marinobacterium weihaiense]
MASMNQTTRLAAPPYTPLRLVLTGALALAVAMGVGRFAFTPLLPLMLRDGLLDTTSVYGWASANYLGYLMGALSAFWLQRHPLIGLKAGLLGIALMTLSTGILDIPQLAQAGIALRFGCGLLSAWVLVCTSSWCLNALTHIDKRHHGSWIYTGVGAGIALTGTLTWLSGSLFATDAWIMLGLLALLLSVLPLCQPEVRYLSGETGRHVQRNLTPNARHWPLIGCYALSGFGYIIPATYLPALAQQQIDNPHLFGLAWPIFGLAALLSVALVAFKCRHWSHQRTWATAQGVMAVGVLIPAFGQRLECLALSALLVGGTFMLATLAGLQLAREREPDNPTPLLGLMTAGFASSQIAGPILVQQLEHLNTFGLAALEMGCIIASCLLTLTTCWLKRLNCATS